VHINLREIYLKFKNSLGFISDPMGFWMVMFIMCIISISGTIYGLIEGMSLSELCAGLYLFWVTLSNANVIIVCMIGEIIYTSYKFHFPSKQTLKEKYALSISYVRNLQSEVVALKKALYKERIGFILKVLKLKNETIKKDLPVANYTDREALHEQIAGEMAAIQKKLKEDKRNGD